MMENTFDMAQTCCGTPCYLSPELCQDMPYSSKADVWVSLLGNDNLSKGIVYVVVQFSTFARIWLRYRNKPLTFLSRSFPENLYYRHESPLQIGT